MILIAEPLTFDEWRRRVRPLLAARISPPDACRLIEEHASRACEKLSPALSLPAALMRLLENIACFRASGRYELMYRLAWRGLYENPRLLEDEADSDVRHARRMDSAVRRDLHKMHAFVRFREMRGEHGTPTFFAWFEPAHEILRRGAQFFVERFATMRWTIATPDGAAVWDGTALTFTRSPPPENRPDHDAHESLWRAYYRSICNLARINPRAMQREMPRKYWKNLPEAADISELMSAYGATASALPAAKRKPVSESSSRVREALDALSSTTGEGAQTCRRCDLWRHATQAVDGAGSPRARIMLVGEQPGDQEDLRGEPFVGPAGKILDGALAEAGIERSTVYVTNAVKHFKWEPRGKRRLHRKPALPEIHACNIWLLQEIDRIRPRVLVALGVTALRALTGRSMSVEAARHAILTHRSSTITSQGHVSATTRAAVGACESFIVATYHPSAILRAESDRAKTLHASLVADLRRARTLSDESN